MENPLVVDAFQRKPEFHGASRPPGPTKWLLQKLFGAVKTDARDLSKRQGISVNHCVFYG